jgi:hypothetical protein
VQLKRNDRGLEPVSALEAPGVYTARPAGASLKLAVNVEPGAGNTAAIDAGALERWLGGMGNWSYLADEPKIDVAATAPRTNLGWPLLWTVLALVLAETALAKWFSHAKA